MVCTVSFEGMLFLKPRASLRVWCFVVMMLPRESYKMDQSYSVRPSPRRARPLSLTNPFWNSTHAWGGFGYPECVGLLRGRNPSRVDQPGVGRPKSYLVDPASSHMLVSKIKPCMSKYKQLYTVKLRTAHYISNYLFDGF